eukprot:jgi/Chlat1/7198/Chrsp57S06852
MERRTVPPLAAYVRQAAVPAGGGAAASIAASALLMAQAVTVINASKSKGEGAMLPVLRTLCVLGLPRMKFLLAGPLRPLSAPLQVAAGPLMVLSVAGPLVACVRGWVVRKRKAVLADVQDETACVETPLQTEPFGSSIANPSEGDLRKLADVKAALSAADVPVPQPLNDGHILRYVRVLGTAEAATTAFRNHLNWRANYTFASKELMHKFDDLVFWHKQDKYGRPCLVVRMGAALPVIRKDRAVIPMLVDVIVAQMEFATRHLLQDGRAEQIAVVLDVEGIGLTSVPIHMIKHMVGVLGRNYPLRLGVFYIVRAPMSVNFVLAALKSILHPVTREKISVAGRNCAPELMRHFDEADLSRFFGGSCKCSVCVPEEALPAHQQLTIRKGAAPSVMRWPIGSQSWPGRYLMTLVFFVIIMVSAGFAQL